MTRTTTRRRGDRFRGWLITAAFVLVTFTSAVAIKRTYDQAAENRRVATAQNRQIAGLVKANAYGTCIRGNDIRALVVETITTVLSAATQDAPMADRMAIRERVERPLEQLRRSQRDCSRLKP